MYDKCLQKARLFKITNRYFIMQNGLAFWFCRHMILNLVIKLGKARLKLTFLLVKAAKRISFLRQFLPLIIITDNVFSCIDINDQCFRSIVIQETRGILNSRVQTQTLEKVIFLQFCAMRVKPSLNSASGLLNRDIINQWNGLLLVSLSNN